MGAVQMDNIQNNFLTLIVCIKKCRCIVYGTRTFHLKSQWVGGNILIWNVHAQNDNMLISVQWVSKPGPEIYDNFSSKVFVSRVQS
jgi:hypothetical protein